MNSIKVAIGIIIKKNKIYITRGNYQEDVWEFPGGKIKKNENIISGLRRELFEEIDIVIWRFRFFQYVKHYSFKKTLHLYFFLIHEWKGEAYSKEKYFYCWTFFYNLKTTNFPLANYSVIVALKKNKNIF